MDQDAEVCFYLHDIFYLIHHDLFLQPRNIYLGTDEICHSIRFRIRAHHHIITRHT